MVEVWNEMLNSISGDNQVVAGAISLWLLGVGTFLLRNVPKGIFNFFKRQLTTSITFNNGGFDETQTMTYFMKWVEPKITESLSRTLSIQNDIHKDMQDPDRMNLGLGYGWHVFFNEGRLFWLFKDKLESSGSERQKEQVSLYTFGRSHIPFKKIIEEMTPSKEDGRIGYYQLSTRGEWQECNSLVKRDLTSIAMDKHITDNLVCNINHFKQSSDWYYKNGLPYKLTYLLHGKPGGGKTSLVKAIASMYDMNVCSININSISDTGLEKALNSLPENSVVLIEDFDSSSATKGRMQDNDPTAEEFSFLSLTGILNALDGIASLDNCIVFLTTNHLDMVDPALYRSGRVDHLLEINEVDGEDIKAYSEGVFPDVDFEKYEFNPAMGCKLNKALLYSKGVAEKYIESLCEGGVVEKKQITTSCRAA